MAAQTSSSILEYQATGGECTFKNFVENLFDQKF